MAVDHMQRNRFELKYLIDERTARAVRDFARPYLERDEHARAETAYSYPIHSLYLDCPGLLLYGQTNQGQKNRFKLRVRYYDDTPTSPLYFEIKRRVNDIILKERAKVKQSSLHDLLGGRGPLRSDLVDEHDTHGLMNLNWFFQLQQSIRAEGRVIVSYLREAWNAPHNDGVRLTFDRKVVGAWYRNSLGLAEKRWATANVGDEVILELKFNGRFPQWMHALVAEFRLRRVPLGKYICCCEALGPQGPVVTPGRHAALSVEQIAHVGRILQQLPTPKATRPNTRSPSVLAPGTFAAT